MAAYRDRQFLAVIGDEVHTHSLADRFRSPSTRRNKS